jgi:pimeloyl-ACP methyl ester carboxylesterase
MQNKLNLLLLHGALGSKGQFKVLKKYLASDFNILDFDFFGHGGKPFGVSPFSIDGFTKEVLRFLEENEIPKVSIFGYSMGGYVALNLALKFPEKMNKIFTLGTKMQWNPQIAAKEIKMLNPEIIEAKVPQFAAILQKRHAPNNWKKLLIQTAQMMTGLGNGKAIQLNDFSKIKHHIVIGIGALDSMVSLQESSEVADQLPNGKIKVFEGFKHPIEQTDAKVLAEKLILFFKETNISK